VTSHSNVPAGSTTIPLASDFTAGHNYGIGASVSPAPADTTHFRAYVRNAHAAGVLSLQAGFASGDYEVSVVNPDGQSGVGDMGLRIQMVPRINTITPTVLYGQQGFTLTVAGDAFDALAQLAIDGTALSTTMNGDGSLSAPVAAGLAPGNHEIRVINPDGSFGSYRSLLGDTQLALTGVSPVAAYTDQSAVIKISGNNIGADGGCCLLTYLGGYGLSTTVNPDGSLTASIPAGILAGSYPITIVNPNGQSATLGQPFTIRPPPSQLLVDQAEGDVLPGNLLRLETRRFTIDPLGTTANQDQHGHIEYFVDDSTARIEKYDLSPLAFGGLSSGLHLLVNNDGTAFPGDDVQLVDFVVRAGTGAAGGFTPPSPDVVYGPGVSVVSGDRLATVVPAGAPIAFTGQEMYPGGAPVPTNPDYGVGAGGLVLTPDLLGSYHLALNRDLQGHYADGFTAPVDAGDYTLSGAGVGAARQLFSAFDSNGVFQHGDVMTVTAPTEILIGSSGTIRVALATDGNPSKAKPVVGRRVFLRIGNRYLEAYTGSDGKATFDFAPAQDMRTTDYMIEVSFFGDYWWKPASSNDSVVTIRFKGQPDVHVGPRPIDTNTPLQFTGEDWPGAGGDTLLGQIQQGDEIQALDVSAVQGAIPAGSDLTLVAGDGSIQTVTTTLDTAARDTTINVQTFTSDFSFEVGSHVFQNINFISLATAIVNAIPYTSLAVTALAAAVPLGTKLVIGYGTTAAQTVLTSAAAAQGATSIAVQLFTAISDLAVGSLIVINQRRQPPPQLRRALHDPRLRRRDQR